MASNADPACGAIAAYLEGRLGLPVEFINGIPWQERERLFDEGEIQLCWICGLPYVWKADRGLPRIELLAAPVMAGARYGDRSVYFSDVVVRRGSLFKRFEDLRGASWAYNEPRSHSGNYVVRHRLAEISRGGRFFGRVVESGAHQASLDMILAGEVDASAIDSTVLETELQARPEISERITIIETLGPSPMPPWVCLKSLPRELRDSLRLALLGMRDDERGRSILLAGRMSHFARVEDKDYDPIRRMALRAERVAL
ncbi:MAG TPA: PhnD/SsuA/transferrin family substrate-binding protein [Blastocatellia bacterium]|nr:PhnD/SsuA/transferrin family substrate-binding protein [Blastocatellia bacterium]